MLGFVPISSLPLSSLPPTGTVNGSANIACVTTIGASSQSLSGTAVNSLVTIATASQSLNSAGLACVTTISTTPQTLNGSVVACVTTINTSALAVGGAALQAVVTINAAGSVAGGAVNGSAALTGVVTISVDGVVAVAGSANLQSVVTISVNSGIATGPVGGVGAGWGKRRPILERPSATSVRGYGSMEVEVAATAKVVVKPIVVKVVVTGNTVVQCDATASIDVIDVDMMTMAVMAAEQADDEESYVVTTDD